MRISGALVFSAGLAAIAAYAVMSALRWPAKAALFPLVMGIPLLVLALVQMVIDARGAGLAEDAPPHTRAAAGVMGWMALFIALVFLLGFPFAVPLFIFGYLTLAGRESWLLSIVLAFAAWGVFYLLFQKLLHFPFESGWLTGGGI